MEEKDTDELIAPKKDFVELSSWKESMKKKHKLDYLPDPSQFNIKTCFRSFRGKRMEGVMELIGEAGRFEVRESSSATVSKKRVVQDANEAKIFENQTGMKVDAARSSMLGSATDKCYSVSDIIAAMKVVPEAAAGEEPESSDEKSSDSGSEADERADDALDAMMRGGYGIGSSAGAGACAPTAAPTSTSATKRGQGQPVSSPATKKVPNKGNSRTTAAPARRGGAQTPAKGAKFDEDKELASVAKHEASLEAIRKFGQYQSIKDNKSKDVVVKEEKVRQRKAQAVVLRQSQA